jgi:hypothetical protein
MLILEELNLIDFEIKNQKSLEYGPDHQCMPKTHSKRPNYTIYFASPERQNCTVL